eukprot:SAG22_NODE_223_length_14745_cov_16.175065_5_plen_93_part_00
MDGSGNIDIFELKAALELLGKRPSDEELQKLLVEMDTDGDGSLGFDEFMAMLNHQSRNHFFELMRQHGVMAMGHGAAGMLDPLALELESPHS